MLLVWGKAEASRERGEKGRARGPGVCMGLPSGQPPSSFQQLLSGAHGAPLATTIGPGGTFVLSQANQRMTALLMDSGTKKLFPSVHEQRAMSDQENLTPIGDPRGASLRLRKTAGEGTKLGPR